MNVAEIMEHRNAFSFEVFPPKTDVGMEKLCGEGGVLDKLYTLNPDYISCTGNLKPHMVREQRPGAMSCLTRRSQAALVTAPQRQ